MKGLTCVSVAVLVVLCCWGPVVEAKNRNRVQKWQQRTWKSRFGSGPRSDWKFDGSGTAKGRSDHRKNLYASARYGGLSQREVDLLAPGDRVPNGYSNYHFRLEDDPKKQIVVSDGSVHRGHRGKKEKVGAKENEIQNFRMKRFAVQDEEDDGEPERFRKNYANSPFVFAINERHKKDEEEEYSDEQQGFNNDVVDLDLVREDTDETIDFEPIKLRPNQQYVTVEEQDPFPHAAPPPAATRKNSTRKVQYTLIIHHGADKDNGLNGADAPGGRNSRWPLLLLLPPVLIMWMLL